MVYSELHFRGTYTIKERERRHKERLIAASFNAWQVLQGSIEKMPKWGAYVKQLGLSDEPELTKEDLKREADQAMEKVKQIVAKARATNG